MADQVIVAEGIAKVATTGFEGSTCKRLPTESGYQALKSAATPKESRRSWKSCLLIKARGSLLNGISILKIEPEQGNYRSLPRDFVSLDKGSSKN